MKKILIFAIAMFIIPSALAEATDIRNMYEFTDQYNKYLYDCIDEFGFDPTHNLSETVYMSSNGVVNTSAGMFFLDSGDGITYCGLESCSFENNHDTDTFIYRTISAITALEYSPSEVIFKDYPLTDTLNGPIFTAIVTAIDQNSEEIKTNGNSGVIASGNYDYTVVYIDTLDSYGVCAQAREA